MLIGYSKSFDGISIKYAATTLIISSGWCIYAIQKQRSSFKLVSSWSRSNHLSGYSRANRCNLNKRANIYFQKLFISIVRFIGLLCALYACSMAVSCVASIENLRWKNIDNNLLINGHQFQSNFLWWLAEKFSIRARVHRGGVMEHKYSSSSGDDLTNTLCVRTWCAIRWKSAWLLVRIPTICRHSNHVGILLV